MKKLTLFGVIVILGYNTTYAQNWDTTKQSHHRETSTTDFTISIDEELWNRWGFRYPATYVFAVADLSQNIEIHYRFSDLEPWQALEKKHQTDLFNGIACVRLDSSDNKAYVSIGFNNSNTIHLKFFNTTAVTFESLARYYDNRKAVYTLSNDNWGRQTSANPGAPWAGMTNNASDKYQASVHAIRLYNIPQSIAINSIGRLSAPNLPAMWQNMQAELNFSDFSWEPAVHTRTHPCNASQYAANGYAWEIVGCSDDILDNLSNIPYGQNVFEFILPCGFQNDSVKSTSSNEFLFLRGWSGSNNPWSTDYSTWNSTYNYYGIGGYETISYDKVFEARNPKGRYYASDVTLLNNAFDQVYNDGGIFYAMFHADRYTNSVLYDTLPGVDGVCGSSLLQHLEHVANRTDVWYVANGWLYSYRMVADFAAVSLSSDVPDQNEITPRRFSLTQNYPNPFNASTVFTYQLPHQVHVKMKIYNQQGREVRTLVDGVQAKSINRVTWDGTDNYGHDVSNGIYLCVFYADNHVERLKIVYLK